MARDPNDPWSYGVSAEDAGEAENERRPRQRRSPVDDTARHHTGRWTSPSLGAYDPSAEHEALGGGDGADDAYFERFGYGQDFGDGRLASNDDGPNGLGAPPPSPSHRGPVIRPASADEGVAAPPPDPAGQRWNDGGQSADGRWPAPVDGPERNGGGALSDPFAPAPGTPMSWSDDPEVDRHPGGRFGPTGSGAVGDGPDLAYGSEGGDGDGPRFGAADEYGDYDDLDGEQEELDSTRNLIEWAVVLVGAVLLALILRALVVQAFWIPSASMETTLLVRDRVLVNKVSYRVGDIGRGDIIVFRRTDEEIAANPEIPRDVIKRVIATENEVIEIVDNQVFIDGLLLREPYLDPGIVTTDFGPETVPEGHVFVMGDNRPGSSDSRAELGPISEDRVVGRAFFVFWPLNRLGSL